MSSPDQDLFDLKAELARLHQRLIGLGLVVDQLAVAVVAVHGHQDVTSRVGDPLSACRAAEAAEHLGMDNAETGAREHRNGKLGNHREVERHSLTRLHTDEVPEECGELVHPDVELLVSDRPCIRVLRLGHPDEGGLVATHREVAVDAVVRGVQSPSDEPLPKRRVAGVERGVPVGVPGEQVPVFLEAPGEVLLAEAVEDRRVGGVRLADELRGRVVVVLLAPMNGDLRLRDLRLLSCRHRSTSRWKTSWSTPSLARA